MFTVKYIDTKGVERLFEADRIEKIQTGDRFADGIFLDPEPEPCYPRPEPNASVAPLSQGIEDAPRSFKHVIHFADCRSSNDVEPVVYVMNRFGSTVATYRL